MPVKYCDHDYPENSECPHCELMRCASCGLTLTLDENYRGIRICGDCRDHKPKPGSCLVCDLQLSPMESQIGRICSDCRDQHWSVTSPADRRFTLIMLTLSAIITIGAVILSFFV